MTERDPLRSRFDAFQDQSVRTANPPPVEEIPRRLRRGRRQRAAAAVLAAVALIALVTLPSWRHSTPPPPLPATSPTPTPSPSSSSAAAAAPPAAVQSSSGMPHSATSAGTCSTSARGLPVLPNGREALLSANDGYTAMMPLPANLFDLCPTARLPFVHVSYGWDIERAQYVQIRSTSFVLTRSQPSVPRPAMRALQNNGCGWIETLLATGRSVPATIPRSVQDSANPNNAAMTYLQRNALALPYMFSIYTYDTLMADSSCVPPPSPPA